MTAGGACTTGAGTAAGCTTATGAMTATGSGSGSTTGSSTSSTSITGAGAITGSTATSTSGTGIGGTLLTQSLLMELSALCRVEVEEGLALVALIGNDLSKAWMVTWPRQASLSRTKCAAVITGPRCTCTTVT